MPQFNEHVMGLPADFDGDFYFTNPRGTVIAGNQTEEKVFIAKWGGKEYHFSPMTRAKMIIRGATPEEVNQIRKKFAKDLATEMFFETQRAKQMEGIERQANGEPVMRSIHQANVYSDSDLKPYIQACLDPLPVGRVEVVDAVKERVEDKLTRDEDGEIVSRAVRNREPLKEKVFKDDPTSIAG